MTATLSLLVFVVLATLVARRVLVVAVWPTRAPGLAIWAWQAVSLSVAAALLLAGFTLILPLSHLSVDLAELLSACATHLRERYETPLGTGLALTGGATAIGILARLVYAFLAVSVDVGRRRRHLRDLVHVLSTPDPSGEYVTIDHDVPLVYCLPGGRSRPLLGHRGPEQTHSPEVVVTTAALECLSAAELRGVLRHERAHLDTRHDLAIGAAHALARAFTGLSIFRMAAEQITVLAEMQADDRSGPRRPLATALMRLGTAQAPLGALGAHGTNTLRRAQRLLEPGASISPRLHLTILGGPMLVLILPIALALTPALLTLGLDHCAGLSPGSC